MMRMALVISLLIAFGSLAHGQIDNRSAHQFRQLQKKHKHDRWRDIHYHSASHGHSHRNGHLKHIHRGLPTGYSYGGYYGYSPFVNPPIYVDRYSAPYLSAYRHRYPLPYGPNVYQPNLGYGGYPTLAPSLSSVPPVITPPPPQSRILSSRFVPNDPIDAVVIHFYNGGVREVQVSIVDLKTERHPKTFRLVPGTKQAFRMKRDNGGTRVEEVETYDVFGKPMLKTVRQPVAPRQLYGIVVHEISIQSVAIDRTPGANNKIEDINLSGQPLGSFPLPAGKKLQSGTLDVVDVARRQGNQSLIGPILAQEKPTQTLSPIERAVIDAQRSALKAVPR